MPDITLFAVKYGSDPLYDLELFGSVLSARCLDPDIHVHVMTDHELVDFELPVEVTLIPTREFEQWTSGGPHLIKMYATERILNESTRPVVYFDTDIIFRESPSVLLDRIGPMDTVMNAHEGTLQDHSYWTQTLARLATSPSALGSYLIDKSTVMFNSGIVGLMPEHATLMQAALDMAQTCYAFDPEAPFNVEQLCTGRVLSSHTTVHTCEDIVDHYWGWRRGLIHIELEALRDRWRHGEILDLELINEFQTITQPRIDRRDKALARLRRIAYRNDENIGFAYLCYLSAIRAGNGDARVAQKWLDVCLDMIFRSLDAQEFQKLRRSDVAYLQQLIRIKPPWMSVDQRTKAKHYLQISA